MFAIRWLVLLTLVNCAPTDDEIEPPPPPAQCQPLPKITSLVRRDGSRLMLEGNPFRAVGGNVYYLQQMFAYGGHGMAWAPPVATAALDAAVCLSMNVLRTWAFNDTQDASTLRRAPGQYDELGLRGLDRAVAEAKARGIRSILALVNNHQHYGGLPAYGAWLGKQPEDFFRDPAMKQLWKDHATVILSRVNTFTGVAYKDEPAILAWEIGNELRCRSCVGTSLVADTIRELAQFLRASGATQLVADGGDGLDDRVADYRGLSNEYAVRGSEGTSFTAIAGIPELDMVSYHLYPALLGLNPGADMRLWIARHEEKGARANKVAYLGEFGHDPSPGGARDRVRAQIYGLWLGDLFGTSQGSLGLLWQVIPAERRANKNDDGYGVVLEEDPATAGQIYAWAKRIMGTATVMRPGAAVAPAHHP